MCSVVGYVGDKDASLCLLEGLALLEYRGYDSAGIACINNHELNIVKECGYLSNLEQSVYQQRCIGNIGIGHTRWATHGKATRQNAHPHSDCHNKVAVVHNGIIENCTQLISQLEKDGHIFSSQTDTEVIAHLIAILFKQHDDLQGLVSELVEKLKGAYSFLALITIQPKTIIAVRNQSPLCIGIGDGEMFVASDVLAFAHYTKKVIFLPDQTFALVNKDVINVFDFDGKQVYVKSQEITIDNQIAKKDSYQHFMLKELYEQPKVIVDTISSLQEQFEKQCASHDLKRIEQIHFIACGTSRHACLLAESFFSKIAKIKTSVHLSSEFIHEQFFNAPNTWYVFVSQSGETADTLNALRKVKQETSAQTMAIVNVATSTMAREVDVVLCTKAGPEIAVASTKTFTASVALLYWLAQKCAHTKSLVSDHAFDSVMHELAHASFVLQQSLDTHRETISFSIATKFIDASYIIFLGRQQGYVLAQEAALKVQELAYMPALAFAAGELKHGPMALIEGELPVIIFSSQDATMYKKIISNAQ
jgi:glucosamine--fructose-6-phosphate aminotransferase (isomerizing)